MKNKKKFRVLTWSLSLVVLLSVCVRNVVAETPKILPVDHYGKQLTLSEAIKRALSTQAEVKEAFSRLKKEEVLYQGSFREFFPEIKGEFSQALVTGEQKRVSYVDAGIEQSLFQGGKVFAGRNKREARYEGEKERFEQVRLDVELGIRILYVRILEARELTRLAQGQVKELNSAYGRIKRLATQEILPRHQIFSIETLLAKAKHRLVTHKETSDYFLSVLSEMIALNSNEVLELKTLGDYDEVDESVQVYLDSARQYDPIYKIRDFKVKEKQFEKRELYAERFPHISLSAKWNKIDDVFTDTNRVFVGVTGNWNVWDFGRLGSKIKAKSHEIEEVKWEREIEIREHEQELRRLFHELRAGFQKIKLTETVVRERKEVFKNEKTRLIAGERGAGEVVDSFLALEEAKSEKLKAVMEYRVLMAQFQRKIAFQDIQGAREFEEAQVNREDV